MQESINTAYIYGDKVHSTPQNKQKFKKSRVIKQIACQFIPHCLYLFYLWKTVRDYYSLVFKITPTVHLILLILYGKCLHKKQ